MTTFSLKILAIITMFIDHTGAALFPGEIWMRYVGRIAFPIYAFSISEGFVHTHDIRKYLIRLGAFALISEFPFDLALKDSMIDTYSQNVYFTLLFGMVALILIDNFRGQLFWQCVSIACMCLSAGELHTDYKFIGVALIIIFYIYRDRPLMRAAGMVIALGQFYGGVETAALLALIPICFYNGKLGKHKWQKFFYIYYPGHLLLIVLLRRIMTGSWI